MRRISFGACSNRSNRLKRKDMTHHEGTKDHRVGKIRNPQFEIPQFSFVFFAVKSPSSTFVNSGLVVKSLFLLSFVTFVVKGFPTSPLSTSVSAQWTKKSAEHNTRRFIDVDGKSRAL